MKVALFGRGKTGSEVLKLCASKSHPCTNFHRENSPSLEALKECDVIISFIPGVELAKYLPLLLAANKPVISGSTGYDWPKDLDQSLKESNNLWIQGHNFSLGMSLVHKMINALSKAQAIYDEPLTSSITEIHHTKKLDAPSGTSLRWKEWLGLDSKVTSERTGDVVGTHTLKLSSTSESITLTHEAHDRGLFAAGAIWAAHYALKNKKLTGFHWFEDLTQKELL